MYSMKKAIALSVCALAIIVSRPVLMASALSDGQIAVIREQCESIRDDLKALQRSDSRARVYLGRYYETILTKFITPLNVRLVENNLSSTDFIDNQNDFNRTKTNFVIDYIEYQKVLEDLTLSDCNKEPEKFYEKLVNARAKRKIVVEDTVKLRKLISKHLELVNGLEARL